MKQRYTMPVAVFVILEKDSKIFCIRRFNTGFADGMFTLPSGHVEAGETPLVSAIREAREEVGVVVTPEQMRHVHTGYSHRDAVQYIHVYFLATDWSGEPYNAEPEKCDQIGWFAWTDLPEPFLPYVKQNLQDIQQSITYSDFWIKPGMV